MDGDQRHRVGERGRENVRKIARVGYRSVKKQRRQKAL